MEFGSIELLGPDEYRKKFDRRPVSQYYSQEDQDFEYGVADPLHWEPELPIVGTQENPLFLDD